jgi:redox-sensing transcriptional repressor
METKNLSKKCLDRLPIYLHYIKTLPDYMENISATKMARDLGLGEVMVRKDLAKVSDGGRPKLGYVRQDLMADLENSRDRNCTADVILIGAGSQGYELPDYGELEASGLRVMAGFDLCTSKSWLDSGVEIHPMTKLKQFCKDNPVMLAIVTVPADRTRNVQDRLRDCGIRTIWNYASRH